MEEAESWRLCSSCKSPIGFHATYWRCSVSTCNRDRTALFFCSVPCWQAHVPMLRHRDAYAEEERSPSREAWAATRVERANDRTQPGRHSIPPPASEPVGEIELSRDVPHDVLIVASKLKKYVAARSGMRTSDGAMAILSEIVRDACDEAIRNAHAAERKTVLDRDFRRRG
jgi:hypothetical protein